VSEHVGVKVLFPTFVKVCMIKSPLPLIVPPVALINPGSPVMVGVALFTVTFTLVVIVL
jgi:hypothetical protein